MHTRKNLKWDNVSKYVLLYGSFFIYSISSICAKLAAGQENAIKVIFFIGFEVFFLGVYALFWQQTLKKFTLVTAMASKGVVVILNLVWSAMLFREKITLYNIVGAMVVIGGIWVVSSDG